MTENQYTDGYFFDGIDDATDSFHDCYDSLKALLDEAEEHKPEAKQIIRQEIAFYLASFLYLYHRDDLTMQNK